QEGYDDHKNIDKISRNDESLINAININVTKYDSNNDESLTNM
ncbi:19299_t:CDS:2, partial [Gigaspora margarita]